MPRQGTSAHEGDLAVCQEHSLAVFDSSGPTKEKADVELVEGTRAFPL